MEPLHSDPRAEQRLSPFDPVSPKSYGTAVCLSAIFGFLGIQHFYLGRWREATLDLALSLGWFVCFALGEPLWGVAFLAADGAHAFIVTIMLLTGNFRDGQGRIVAYPGQKLGTSHTNQDMRRSI
jgi:TM2 domain-containing membrane protein YozV